MVLIFPLNDILSITGGQELVTKQQLFKGKKRVCEPVHNLQHTEKEMTEDTQKVTFWRSVSVDTVNLTDFPKR